MASGSNMFSVLSGDDDMADSDFGGNNARKRGQQNQQNNNKKGGGGKGEADSQNNSSKVNDGPSEEQKRARADKLFKQRNELSDDKKKARNKQKKLKKVENKAKANDPRSPASTKVATTAAATTTAAKGAAGAKAPAAGTPAAAAAPVAPAAPAAPLKTAEEKKKEEQEKKQKKVKDYLEAVDSALPGHSFLFKLDLNQFGGDKDKGQTAQNLREKPYKTIEQIIATPAFLTKFKENMPSKLRSAIPQGPGLPKEELVPLGRYEMKSVFIPDFPLHLAALLSGPTDNGETKTPAETATLVEDLLDGLFDARPPPRRQRFDNRGEDEDDADEYIGSAGSHKKDALQLSDFITNATPSRNQLRKQKKKQDAAGTQAQEDGSKGKEPEVQPTPQVDTAAGSSSSAGAPSESAAQSEASQEQKQGEAQQSQVSRRSALKKDINDPTTYLTDEVIAVFPDNKLATLARKIPKGWRVAQVRNPIFSATGSRPERASFGGGRGGGGRGGGGERSFGRPNPNAPAPAASAPAPAPVSAPATSEGKSGFMYSGKGLDQCYVIWKDQNMYWLFTTGKLPKPVPTQEPAATPAPSEGQQPSSAAGSSDVAQNKGGASSTGGAQAKAAGGAAQGSSGNKASSTGGAGGAGRGGSAPAGGQAKGQGKAAAAPKAEAKPKTGK